MPKILDRIPHSSHVLFFPPIVECVCSASKKILYCPKTNGKTWAGRREKTGGKGRKVVFLEYIITFLLCLFQMMADKTIWKCKIRWRKKTKALNKPSDAFVKLGSSFSTQIKRKIQTRKQSNFTRKRFKRFIRWNLFPNKIRFLWAATWILSHC